MTMKTLRLASLLLALIATRALAVEPPPNSPRPGGIAVVALPDGRVKPSAVFGDRPVMVLRREDDWLAVIGIPLNQSPGDATVQVYYEDESIEVPFTVNDHAYREQRLTVERQYVEPDSEHLERITRERKVLDAALTGFGDTPPANFDLPAPVPGRQSDSFGFRRVFNDQPRRPHSGMDIAAPAGTPVRAPLGGRVAATGEFFFNGNTVIVDHGQGFITAYLHLDRIDVETGQSVDAGQTLGVVGATGRVTGAHLHFATYLNGTPVDPALFLDGER